MSPLNFKKSSSLDLYLRRLNRYLLGVVVVFIPIYIFLKFASDESIRIKSIGEVIERIKEPIVWSVPRNGVRYASYFKGVPDEGNKFVLVDLKMKAMMKKINVTKATKKEEKKGVLGKLIKATRKSEPTKTKYNIVNVTFYDGATRHFTLTPFKKA